MSAVVDNPFFKNTAEELYAVSQGHIPVSIDVVQIATIQLPAIKSATDLILANLPRPEELVAGVLHQGLKGVLASSSKAGKTWLLLDMGLSIASGLPWIKWPTKKSRVLVVNFELTEWSLCDRIHHLRKTRADGEYDLTNLHTLTLRGYSSKFGDLLKAIATRVRHEAYGLIIIDPIYKGLAGADENAAGDIAKLCGELELLCVETGAAVVYAHHFSKGNKANQHPLDRLSGSGVFARDPDTIIMLTNHEQKNCYTVDLVLRNHKQVDPFVVEWQFPFLKLRDDLRVGDLAGKGGRPQAGGDLLDLLKSKALTTTEWQKAAKRRYGISKATFNRRKADLVEAGKVEKNEETSKWSATSDRQKANDSSPTEE